MSKSPYNINLKDIRTCDTQWAVTALWHLLEDREKDAPNTNISHAGMPTWAAHQEFVLGHPYRMWCLIQLDEPDARTVGSIYVTRQNEIGVYIHSERRRMGFARKAIQSLMANVKPLPAIPSLRSGSWLANINPNNAASIALFESLGFNLKQLTFTKEE